MNKLRECHAYLLEVWPLKVDYLLYKISKKEPFNGKNIGPAYHFKLWNNFLLTPPVKATQINKIQRELRPPFKIMIAQSCFLLQN